MKNLRGILLLMITLLATEYLRGQAPGWSVNPGDYTYNGTVTAEVYLGPALVTGGTLGAFVGAECRGVVGGTLINERAVFFLTCYSDLESGETLEFKYYDPVGDDIYNVNETIPFSSGMSVGSSDTPYTLHITVNAAPVVGTIPEPTIAEGGTFGTIDLDDYVADPDNTDAEITWSYTGNTALNVDIDPVTHILTVTVPNEDWNGAETIQFTATDPIGSFNSDEAVFTVTAVNDPPFFTEGSDQTVSEDAGSQTLSAWATGIGDGDPEIIQTLTFSVSNDNNGLFSAQPAISPDGTLTYTPAANANGLANVSVFLYDNGGGTTNFSETETFTITVTAVNDPPSFVQGGNQMIEEDAGPISVSGWATSINDGDPEFTQVLNFVVSNDNTALFSAQPAISPEGTLTYTPALNAYGTANVNVILTDNGDGTNQSPQQTFTITVEAVNDTPVVSDIPDQSVPEGSTFTEINLNNYVTDVDNAVGEMSWSYSGNSELSVSIEAGMATIGIPTAEWSGSEIITFRATDPGTLSATDAATFQVTAVNDVPVVTDIPDQTINEGSNFALITLDNYVSDADNTDAEITWTYSGNTNLTVNISDRTATITIPGPEWNGSETITFRATDPGLSWDEDDVVFTVNGVNDAPVVGDIPDQTINEGLSFATISLDDYVADIDNIDSEITWTWSGNSELTVAVSTARVATISVPGPEWSGAETITFTATDPGLLSDSDPAIFTVNAVNDAPVVTGIPDQSVSEGSPFTQINLSNYVTDVDNANSELSWGYSGNDELLVSIESNIATISVPNVNWNGSETITFTATDPGLLSDSDDALFTVTADNDPPVVGDIPNQTTGEGGSFESISLDTYVTDPDNIDSEITWTYSGNMDLTVNIDINRIATITVPDADWNGSETITFTATDPGLLTDNDQTSFTVSAFNDPPIVANIPDQTIAEGGTFLTINLDDYVADPDNPDTELTWTVTGNSALSVSINDRVATITPVNSDWNGSETLTFTATDPGELSNSDDATFTVTPVNDSPVVSDIPDQTIAEGALFLTISLDDFVSDVDNTDAEITWTYSGNTDLNVTITDRVATISPPDINWNGSEIIIFTATDDESASDSDEATFTVSPVNDPPVVSGITDQIIDEGSAFVTISLDNYVSDVDHSDDQMTWTYSGNTELSVSILDRVATISVPDDDWNGVETIIFRATDPESAFDEDAATFTVTAVNDAPVVAGISDQTIDEGSDFVTIALDDFVTDPDNDDNQIAWTWSGNIQLQVSIVSRVATIKVPEENWFGVETITFTARDPLGLTGSDEATFTVNSVNDAPVITNITGQTINEGSVFATINLDDYASDVDNSDVQLTWTSSGNSELQVSIVARVATIMVPSADWNGSETVTFRVTDPGGLYAEDAATFTVNGINDAPVVTDIPDQEISEGSSFTPVSLGNYVSDVDNSDDQIAWTWSGNSMLNVSIAAGVAAITVTDPEWNGSETITFRATDPGGSYDEDEATFTVIPVNDAPVVSDITDRTINEGSTFATITLDNFVTDTDNPDNQIDWTYSGNTELTVSIVARVATIIIPNSDWYGSETITFTATDPGGLSAGDAATFTVNAVNDPPVVADIPNQSVPEGNNFATINLDNYVSDIDNTDAEIVWTSSGSMQLTVSIVNRIATITVPGPEWNGSETITFRATDPGSSYDEDVATFTISAENDPPVVTNIPDQSRDEGAAFATINLDDYVSDADNPDSDITWTSSGGTVLSVSISNRVATVTTTNPDWNGSETITFTATDPGGLSNSTDATFTVTPVNDAPVVGDIPNQTVAEGATFATISLDDFVTDVDNPDSQITWTYSGNTSLTVSIESGVATIAIPNINWNGSETITFTATDPDLLSDTDQATFTVTSVNDPPVVAGIPDQTIYEGEIFLTILLNDYVSDPDHEDGQMTWSYSGNTDLTVSIASGVATITVPDADWYGSETITFTATDPLGGSDNDQAMFTVTAENDAPVVTDIPNQTINEGSSFVSIALNNYVSDVDNDVSELSWIASGNTALTVSIASGTATITIPDENWNGSEIITFTATDPGGLYDSDPVTFTINAVNDPPVVTDIPDQTITEGSTFTTINLNGFVSDIDNSDIQITWTSSGNTQLDVSIVLNVVTITAPSTDWNGSETITFRATDPGGLFDEDAATFTVTPVNDAPVVTDIPDQTINEGSTFTTISLDTYISDVDNSNIQIAWTYSGNSQLSVSILNRIATITIPDADWNGSETITFRATDPGGLFDEDAATFTVNAVNDPPVVSDIMDRTINEGSTFATIILDNFVTDPDNPDNQISWTSSGNTDLTVSIESRVATITVPSADWNGSETITFRATDPGGLYDEDAATFTVTAVNDPPVVGDIPNQSVMEGSGFTSILLANYVSDIDNADSQMTWTYSGNSQLTVSINNGVATVSVPSAEWNGSETITFRATDPGGLYDEDAVTFTVSADNDPPLVTNIPDQTRAEGAAFATINLDNYVSDADNTDSQITWTTSGGTVITVSIVNRVATITAGNSDWNGSETITFTATDPGGLSNSTDATFTVTPVNDAPSVGDIPNQTIAEGATFATISLDDFVTDVDNTDSQIAWTYSGNTSLTVSIESGVATITISDINWNGSETITFRATDPGSLSDADAAVFTVTAVNDPPVLAGIASTPLAYTENAPAAIIANTLTVTDIDDTNIESATITISGNYQSGQDILSFINANGITGTWNAGTGTLNLSGTATMANYQLALRNVRYFNNSDNPSTLTRTISFTVNDGSAVSSSVTRQIAITAVNDIPVAASVTFSGIMISGSTLTGSYIYSDAEGDPEGISTFSWYRADNASGLNETVISGATGRTYVLVSSDAGKYISFQVTPAAASGNTPGVAVRSSRQLVIKLPEGWEVNPQNFDYDGSVTASVSVSGVPQESGFLAAFVGEECRGIAGATHYVPTDNYVFRMTCYSDNLSGDILTFKYYDPVKDIVHDMDRSVDFTAGMIEGSSANPVAMNNGTLLRQVHPSGWSWFSVNTFLDNMSLSFILPDVTDGDYIKSQSSSATYYEGYGWFGSLTDIDPTELYKIKLQNGCITEFTGRPIDVETVSIPISSGWNWIGFLPQTSMAVSTALSSLVLSDFDYIKSQSSSATYYEGYGWFGSLGFMDPNQGYMIKLANSGILNYSGSVKKGSQILPETKNSQFDFHQYENSGEIAAVVFLDGIQKGSAHDSLIAYVNNEIRGVSAGEYFGLTNQWMFSLIIYSNVTRGEIVNFKYYDSANKKYYTCIETIPFEQNTTPDRLNPYLLHASVSSSIEEENIYEDPKIRIYPNPFEYSLNIDYSIFEPARVRISVFDTFGNAIRIIVDQRQEPGDYNIKWDSNLPSAGTYFIRFESGRRQKIIKAILMRSH